MKLVRFFRFLLLVASLVSVPFTVAANAFNGSIFAIERYSSLKRSYITEPYDIFCLQRPGFMVEIPWDASQFYGDPEMGQIEIELIDMGMIECKHGWDLHEMGNRRQGSGGTEWVAVYGDQYLVRFTAMEAKVVYSLDGVPSIKASVHLAYCENETAKCEINMKIPLK